MASKRQGYDKRRDQLIQATIRSVARRGLDGASIQRITAVAGVSRGLVHHYFKSKDDLLCAAYSDLGEGMLAALEPNDTGGYDPLVELARAIRASFEPPLYRPTEIAAWLGFLQASRGNRRLRALNMSFYTEYRARVEALVAGVIDALGIQTQIEGIAQTLTLLMDGLWMNATTDPSAVNASRAVELCTDYLGIALGLSSNDLDRLRDAAEPTQKTRQDEMVGRSVSP